MTKEYKELLLKDLCARLPYGVMVYEKVREDIDSIVKPIDIGLLAIVSMGIPYPIVKPYLRPMSSMTEEEFEDLKIYSGLIYSQLDLISFQNGTHKCLDFYLNEIPSYVVIFVFDWLNKNHFDYRGLIEKGLALEAPEGMYKTE